MRRRAVVLAGLLLGCGDNLVANGPALATAPELVVVAHPGDELLFMQPDVLESVQRGEGVTIVYVFPETAEQRTRLMAAYSVLGPHDEWQCGEITLDGEPLGHCRLAAKRLSLVFEEQSQDKVTLAVMRETNPRLVRTQELVGTHGSDDTPHIAAGALAVWTLAYSHHDAEVISYRGESIAVEPPNKPAPLLDLSARMLAAYGDLPGHDLDAVERRYAIGVRRTGGGRLRLGNRCLSDALTMIACEVAPIWTIDSAGEIRDGAVCLTTDGGTVSTGDCLGGADRRWFVDDEGHIFSPFPGPTVCLAADANGATVEVCGKTTATWELAPNTASNDPVALGFPPTGRAVRLGDLTGDNKADLCAVTVTGGLRCIVGKGDGTFLPSTRVDNPSSPLAIDPRSLTLGDVDGDGRLDACGRDSQGVLCATSTASYSASRWTLAFSDSLATEGTSASLTAIDLTGDHIAELCALDATGVECAAHDETRAATTTLSTAALAPDATVWFGDLDNDLQADWCTAADAGPACAVAAQAELTTEPSPWAYAYGGIADVARATTVTVALADIDRDGRADLCTLLDDRIACARSQGRAFGPRKTTLAILPAQSVASALWLGDLDGDGRADACADTGTAIVCAVQP